LPPVAQLVALCNYIVVFIFKGSDMNTQIEKIRYFSRKTVRELGVFSGEYTENTPSSFCHALIELNLHGAINLRDLSLLLNLDKSTVSRIVQKLKKQQLITIVENQNDARHKHLLLTPAGKEFLEKINKLNNERVRHALLQLTGIEQKLVVQGLELYAKALARSRVQKEFQIRAIKKNDNIEMMVIIKNVLQEYGADQPGFAFVDPELNDLCSAYGKKKCAYLVIEKSIDKKIVGGVGIGPLMGGDSLTCELRKMYFLPQIRGLGLGHHLLEKILSVAKENGYRQCYIETIQDMEKANNLYQKFGFIKLRKPLGNTGHYGCNVWYVKKL
jgi:putative acetyltransferase